MSTIAWMREHARLPDGSPFDEAKFPHVTAPGGILEALDDPRYREYCLQWATRLGKTATGELYLMKRAASDPCPMLFTTGTRDLVKRNTETKLYPQLEHTAGLKEQLLPKHDRQAYRIDLDTCRIFCGWSGSDATLADLSAKVVLCSEIDKWDTATSREADPVRLAAQRAKEYPDRQIIYESTPSIKGRSRIERLRAASTDHRLYVPCPKCGKYQTLAMNEGDDPRRDGGLVWDKDDDGKSNPDVAYKTARYVCRHCRYEIHDDQRPAMMRAGVWAAHGQTVQRGGRVRGPLPETMRYGSQLSSLYALSLDWGDMAYRFLTSKDRPREFQDFVNGDLGETFELVASVTDADDLAARCCRPYKIGEVPEGVVFVTIGVDRQLDRWVWMVCGWGHQERGWILDYGETPSDEQLRQIIMAGRGGHLPAMVLVDSGFATNDVYKFCDTLRAEGQPVAPLKGMTATTSGKPWNISYRDTDKKQKRLPLVQVATNYWQEVIQSALDFREPEEFGGLSLPAEAATDEDLLEQLLNEAPATTLDTRNYEKTVWCRRDENMPNDYRDTLRYARVAAEMWTRRQWRNVRPVAAASPPKRAQNTEARSALAGRASGVREMTGRRW